MRIFKELLEPDALESITFVSAKTVYRFRHPIVPDWQARFRIGKWLVLNTRHRFVTTAPAPFLQGVVGSPANPADTF